jgi:hypothetical protein
MIPFAEYEEECSVLQNIRLAIVRPAVVVSIAERGQEHAVLCRSLAGVVLHLQGVRYAQTPQSLSEHWRGPVKPRSSDVTAM